MNHTATRSIALPWIVLEAGQSERSLIIQYVTNPRAAGAPVVSVCETDDMIEVSVRQATGRQDDASPMIAVTGMLRTPIDEMVLDEPIGGRRIEGDRKSEQAIGGLGYLSQPGPGTLMLPAVPRIVGLSVTEAVGVLAAQGFPAAVVGTGSTVIGQRPGRGEVARNVQATVYDVGQPVTLTAH